MFLLRASDRQVHRILEASADRPFTYGEHALTREGLSAAPEGYTLDQYGTELGEGDHVFEAACDALSNFENYPSSFTRVVRTSPTLEAGLVFCTVAHHFGFASVHPCRVVYVIRSEVPRRFGFGLGTLPGHFGAGEERFLVSQSESGGPVRYDVQAFSRPAGFLGRLGAPIFRRFQKRFQEESVSEMRSRCEGPRTAFESV